MTRKLLLSLALMLTFSVGCTKLQIGKPIEGDNVKLIQLGDTDTDRVRELFGTPNWETSHDGGKIYVYRYVNHELTTSQELVISFGEDDRVQTFSKQGL